MKTQVNKWIRWGAAGVFELMLTLNVMVGLDFDKDKMLPTLTLVELGSQANAQSESGDDCEEISGDDGQADVLVCCGATFVMSGWHMSGGCMGENQGCTGSYANGCN